MEKIIREAFENNEVETLVSILHDVEINDLLKSASESGRVEAVKTLLEHGAKVNVDNERSLKIACKNGHAEVVKLLLEWGAAVNTDNNYPLHTSSECGYHKVVKVLLEYNADIHSENDYALRISSECGHVEVVKLLLEKGADINEKDINGDSFLRVSSENGHSKVVRLLLEHGASLHSDSLISACENGYSEVVKVLIEWGARVHQDNNRPIRTAVENNRLKVVKVLLDNISKDVDYDHLVRTSVVHGDVEMTELLNKKWAKVTSITLQTSQNKEEKTLSKTKFSGDYSSVVNKVISSNNTKVALYLIKNKKKEIIPFNTSLVEWALEEQHFDILELLI